VASTAPYWEGYRPQYRPNYRPSSAYVANAMRVVLRIFLGRQWHTGLRLALIMRFSPMLEVRASPKHKVQAMDRKVIIWE